MNHPPPPPPSARRRLLWAGTLAVLGALAYRQFRAARLPDHGQSATPRHLTPA